MFIIILWYRLIKILYVIIINMGKNSSKIKDFIFVTGSDFDPPTQHNNN